MILAQTAQAPFAAPDAAIFGLALARLALAAGMGAALGLSRQKLHKPAGLRTHMLVALGACLAVLVSQLAGMARDDTSRIIQGIVTGIGFLGAGTIIKAGPEGEVHGLTTAAGIWITAVIGVAAGIAPLWLAATATALAWIILVPLALAECWLEKKP